MLKDYVTVIVSMLLVVSIIGLVEIGNNSVTVDSITGMQVLVEDCASKGSLIVSETIGPTGKLIDPSSIQPNLLSSLNQQCANFCGEYCILQLTNHKIKIFEV